MLRWRRWRRRRFGVRGFLHSSSVSRRASRSPQPHSAYGKPDVWQLVVTRLSASFECWHEQLSKMAMSPAVPAPAPAVRSAKKTTRKATPAASAIGRFAYGTQEAFQISTQDAHDGTGASKLVITPVRRSRRTGATAANAILLSPNHGLHIEVGQGVHNVGM